MSMDHNEKQCLDYLNTQEGWQSFEELCQAINMPRPVANHALTKLTLLDLAEWRTVEEPKRSQGNIAFAVRTVQYRSAALNAN